ncbi:MAG: SAM-dependent chlorinase/fluorinase [Bacteroidetes bacterium]|nr:SAM-dependent chlorinase/fluorinase [Bacteroidota bacterium]
MPAPLITLSSDIGQPDYLVGAIKAKLLQINPDFQLVDITHQIPPFHFTQAAYVCGTATRQFPAFTYHLLLISLYEQQTDQLLLAYHQEQYYLSADNGLLTMMLGEKPEIIMGIPFPEKQTPNTLEIAAIMGNTIQRLVEGQSILSVGIPDVSYMDKRPLRPIIQSDYIEAQIIFIDSFENIVVNVTQALFEGQRKGRPFRIQFRRDETIDRISTSYADVGPTGKVALFNSAGYLEIALNKANAAGLFGLKGFVENSQQSQLAYQTVRIVFG